MLKDSLQIIFEDDYLIIFNKPSGLHSVKIKSRGGESLADHILTQFPQLATASEKQEDAGLIHRLDFETSGAIIAAKNSEVWALLREQLKAHKINKEYLALVDGDFAKTAAVKSYLGTAKRHGKKVYSYNSNPGKPVRAIYGETYFNPEKKLINFTLIKASASSATRHQIRVHSASLGHPLCGDDLYGSKTNLAEILKNPSAPKFLLHASKISFVHPMSGKSIQITASNNYLENI